MPWHQPWRNIGAPRNLVSGKTYRGINIWLLLSQRFISPYWISYRQAQELDGQVREGEKATPVVFWKVCFPENEHAAEPEDDATGTERRFVLRYYRVFNSEQCDLPEKGPRQNSTPGPDRDRSDRRLCEGGIRDAQPARNRARHRSGVLIRPQPDRINMPARRLFETAEVYYATLFHELGHSTENEKRLARSTLKELCPFGSSNYSKEELLAEMTAAFLCGHCGIENRTIDNSAAYVAGWLKRLRDDRRLVINAAAQAQHAADYILGVPGEC